MLTLDDPVSIVTCPGCSATAIGSPCAISSGTRPAWYDYTARPALRTATSSPRALVALVTLHDRSEGYALLEHQLPRARLVLEAAAAGEPLGAAAPPVRVRALTASRERRSSPGGSSGAYLHGHERALPGRRRDGALPRHRPTDGAVRRGLRARPSRRRPTSTASSRGCSRAIVGRRMRPRGEARYGLGLARFDTECGPVVGHTGNLLGTVTVVWARGDRMLVAGANAYPTRRPPRRPRSQRLLTSRVLRLTHRRRAAMSRCCDYVFPCTRTSTLPFEGARPPRRSTP